MTAHARYRKRPVEVDAIGPLAQGNEQDIASWCSGQAIDGRVTIPTLEGTMTASAGDYVIRGVQGEYYPCKPDIFQATYEPA